MEWFFAWLRSLGAQIHWLLHLLDRMTADVEGEDVFVTTSGACAVFWPISDKARQLCAHVMHLLPTRLGGYLVFETMGTDGASWQYHRELLEREYGLRVAVGSSRFDTPEMPNIIDAT